MKIMFSLNSIQSLLRLIIFQMPDKKKSNSIKKNKKNSKQRKNIVPKDQVGQIKLSPNVKSSPANLNNIIEVTEQEYNTNRFNTESIQEASAFIQKNKKTFWQKSFECLKHVFWCFGNKAEFSIVVKEDEILKTIEKLRTEKLKTKPFLPPLDSNRKTLVLDIDQTLVYSSQTEMQKYDFSFMMPFKKSEIQVYSKNRFGLESFLFQMSKLYEIVIYTTNIREYVDNVLLNIDKKKRISHVLYKEKCLNLNKIHYLKSLKALGRDPDKVIFIDVRIFLLQHNIASGILQPKNFLALKPYTGEKHDRQLVKLIPFLREMSEKDTVIPVTKNCQEYFNREIRLKFSNLEQAPSEHSKQNSGYASKRKSSEPSTKRRRVHHQKTDSEIKFKAKQEQENEDSSTIGVSIEASNKSKDPTETEVSLRMRDCNAQEAI